MEHLTEQLHDYFRNAAAIWGDKIYLKSNTETLTYRGLINRAEEFKNIFTQNGAIKADRIIIYSSKNNSSVALMCACSETEAVYVPVSSMNPPARAIHIINDTSAKFIVCDKLCANALQSENFPLTPLASLHGLEIFVNRELKIIENNYSDAAFILFTSGSTGNPKGVVVSHKAAITFVDWAVKEFGISINDTLSSIAPFNFDLSVFDIYASAKAGATTILFTEEETKNALVMALKIAEEKISTIYATPTFYTALAYYGKLHKYNFEFLKNVLFAGEVFLPDHFMKLNEAWTSQNYFNLYGPTETNVCTWYKIPSDINEGTVFPIGKACAYAKTVVVDHEGKEITKNNIEGELLVSGDSLFLGYWNDEEQTTSSLTKHNNGEMFYHTGDLVSRDVDGNLHYISRKDRMIKKHGFRIEPSEIERVIAEFEGISGVAIIFNAVENKIWCFLEKNQVIDNEENTLRKYCRSQLPSYMVPDNFVFLESMPKTISGKIDLQALKALSL